MCGKNRFRNLALLSAGTLAGTLAGTEAASAEGRNGSEAPKKPNILFFLVDDLGWSDIGCFGSRFHETPNIDRLAEEGVRFTNAYAACHVSSPTRASLMTGRYPASIRLTDWLPGRKNWPFQRLLNAPVEQHLPFEEITVAETLRDNGYATAIIGKWHLGKGDSNPLAHGFNEHIPLGYNEGWPQGYYAPFRLNGYEGEEGEYLTDVMTREATKYIEEHKDGPFFLYMSHFAVHDPIQGRKDLVEKYRRKLATMHYEGDPYILEGNPDDPDPLTRGELDSLVHTKAYQGYRVLPQRTVKIKQHQDNIEFAAMVEAMDESLGVIRRKLEELGIADNTIVIFYSDNGGMAGANFGRPDRRIAKDALDRAYATSSLPLRGAKGWMYEGGIRVPMIVCYPGVGRAGTECDVPVISNDFYYTLLDMASVDVPKEKVCEGESIVPLLEGGKIGKRALYWHFPHYSNHGMQSPGGAIRYGDYKLLEYFENGTVQLFDLKTDLGEQHDLSAEKPGVVKKLRKMLHAWRESVGASMPEPNPNFTGDKR